MAKSKKSHRGFVLLATIGTGIFAVVIALLLRGHDVILLNPKGFIAEEQYKLMMTSTLIMVAFAVPVLFLLYYFAWKYRESNKKASYNPDSNRSGMLTFVIWGAPTLIAIILSAIMIPATHKLEPTKLIASDKDHMTIQVIALRWKWLFIYPEQNIATVNYVQIPEDTPVQFELTADETPMSSFWIPSLGGMLYAMTEHVNRLNLMGDTPGDYEGSAAEINGSGFAGMRFTTRVSTDRDFKSWVASTQQSNKQLTMEAYDRLVEPSKNDEEMMFADPDSSIYGSVLAKYVGSHSHDTTHDSESHETHYESMDHGAHQ